MHAKIIWPRNPSKRASHSYSALCFRLRRWQRLVVTTILLGRQPKLISSDTNAASILFLHVLQTHNDGAMYVIEHSQISWILTLWYFVHVAACFLFAFRVLTLTLVSRSLKNLHSNSTFQRLALPDTKVRDFALVLTLYSINGLCKHQQTSSVCFVHNSCQCRIWTWKGIAHALICIDIKGLVVRSYHLAHSCHGRG